MSVETKWASLTDETAEEAFKILRDGYFYKTFKGIDWAIHSAYDYTGDKPSNLIIDGSYRVIEDVPLLPSGEEDG